MTHEAYDTTPGGEPFVVRAIAAFVLCAWIGLLLIAAEFPAARLWSINHLAFLPESLRWVVVTAGVLAVGLVLIAPSPVVKVSNVAKWSVRWPGALVFTAAVIGIGWIASARTPLLGDGVLRGGEALLPETPLGSELLASALAQGLIRLGVFSGSTGGYSALGFISLVFSGVLALGLWYYAPRAGIARPWAFIFWILTFGSARLLAGYVESYAPAFAMLVLWGVTAIGLMRGRLSPWPMISFGCLAILSHAVALGVVPASLWLLWHAKRDNRATTTPIIAFPVLVAGLTAFIAWEINRQQVGGIGVGPTHFLMPLLAGPGNPYAMFSLAHVVDFVNHWLLLVPAVLAAGAVVLLSRTVVRSTEPASGQPIERVFYLLAIVPMLIAAFLIDPKLGWARDWDLMTLFVTPALIASAVWLSNLKSAAVLRAAGAVAVISVSLWLAIGARTESEETRFEALLQLDPSRAAYGHEIMAIYHRVNNRPLGEIKHFEAALQYTDNLRYRANIANAYYKLDRSDNAIAWYQSIYERDSTFDVARYSLSLALMREQRYEEALPHAQWSLANKPADSSRAFILGSILLYLQRPQDALPHLEFAAKAAPSNAGYLNILGGCYLRLDRKHEARTAWRRALKADPQSPTPYVNLAGIEFGMGNYAEARHLLDQYATLVPPSQWPSVPRELYDTLQRIE